MKGRGMRGMRGTWLVTRTALLVAVAVACTSTAPPSPPSGTGGPSGSPAATSPADPGVPGASESPAASSGEPGPSGAAPTRPPGSRLGVRYSGTPRVEFQGILTARFDDGLVIPSDASGVVLDDPITQGLGESAAAVRVTGTILSREGTYRVEIVAGHLDPSGVYVVDIVLAADEASGRDGQVLVDYGNVDI